MTDRRARILARMGKQPEARRLLEQVEPNSKEFNPYQAAAAYAALGETEQAFKHLFEMLERGAPGPNFAAVDPPFASLHSDPRWSELIRKLNLPRNTRHASR